MAKHTGIKKVAVTGASGFIGSHVVHVCLERGYDVNAVVRNATDPKNQFLKDLAAKIGGGKLDLFSAELLNMGSYDAAFKGCDAVLHVAAALAITDGQDPIKDMVEPSTKGTENVLGAIDRAGGCVKHYVHTSSTGSIANSKGPVPFTEKDWSDAQVTGGGTTSYPFAKAEAERVVWRLTEGKPYTISCINPSMVFGRCLSKPHCKASPFVFRQALYGNDYPNYGMSVVDVRDVAMAHVEAMERPEAAGRRIIIDGDQENVSTLTIIKEAAAMFPQYYWNLSPSTPDPRLPRQIWDNSLSKQLLGLRYKSQEDVIRDTVISMVESGWVPAKPAAAAKL